MLNYISTLDYIIWCIGLLLQGILVDIIFQYRHHKDFPAFATFATFSFFNSTAQLVVSAFVSRSLVYFYIYWIGQVLVLALLFCVVHEVFESVSQRALFLSQGSRRALIRFATVAAAVAVGVSLRLPQSEFPLMEAITELQRGFGIAVFCLMAAAIVLAQVYSVEWYRRDSGIAIGIFISYAFQTLWPRVSAFLPGTLERQLYLRTVLMLEAAAVLIWLYSFLRAGQHGDFLKVPVMKRRFRVILGGRGKSKPRRAASECHKPAFFGFRAS